MKFKTLPLVFVLNILSISYLCAQNTIKNKKNPIGLNYGNWLKTTGLSRLLRVKYAAAYDSLANRRFVLVLVPAPGYQEPQKFATALNQLKNNLQLKGIDFYALLFDKLAQYTFLPPNFISLKIQTVAPEIYALRLYYDTSLHHDENMVLSKGLAKKQAFGFLNKIDAMRENCFETSRAVNMNSLRVRLELFFKKYRHEKNGIKIDSMINHDGKKLQFRISNILGQVTGQNYHEVLFLNVDMNEAEICYTIDAAYAAGILKIPDPESGFYREVALDFPQKWLSFRDNFDFQLKTIIHEK